MCRVCCGAICVVRCVCCVVCYGIVWYGMAWYAVWYCVVWYGMVCMLCGMWYGMVWYGVYAVWYGMVWYCVVWCVCRQHSEGGLGPFLPPLTSSPIPPIDRVTRVKSTLNKKTLLILISNNALQLLQNH